MEQIILFAFLAIFPFGQIIKIGMINPIDIVVGIAAVWAIIKRYERPEIFKHFQNFLLVSLFTYTASIFIFNDVSLIYGLLYLIRLAAYFYFLIFIWNFKNKKILLNSLLLVIVISAIFGWIQYFMFPDIKPFTIYGWDEHLYRIVGTFLDPSFLSIILIIGIILSPNKFLDVFLTLTLAFTYSRAGYIAFLPAVIMRKKYWLIALLAASIFILPRPAGESVRLERTASISARLDNYKETLNIFKNSPLIGVGFNNLCLTKQKISFDSFSSHACGGSDSSILFILATTGVLGLISFIYLAIKVWLSADIVLKASLTSLSIHSLFTNSAFYPWIMGIVIILLGVSISRSKVKS